jgi:tetratricopeptide (TPR) repeat protein
VFETALSLDPENLIALRHLGDIARARSDIETARAWYRRVLESDPRNEEIAAILQTLDVEAATTPPSAASPPPANAVPATQQPAPATTSPAPGLPPAATIPPSAAVAGSSTPPAPDESAFEDLAALFTGSSSGGTIEGAPVDARDALDALPLSSALSPGDGFEPAFDTAGVPGGGSDSEVESLFMPPITGTFTPPEAQKAAPTSSVSDRPGSQGVASEAPEPSQPAAFVTETMAELYLSQGHREEALNVYRHLLALRPQDVALRARLDELEGTWSASAHADAAESASENVEAGPTIREFLGSLALWRPRGAAGPAAASTSALPADLPMLDTGIDVKPSPRAGGQGRASDTIGGSLDALFKDAEPARRAAGAPSPLEMAFGEPASRDSAAPTAADHGVPLRGRPATPAASELSLDHVFRHATPAGGTAAQSNFSYDQFFSQQAQEAASETANSSGEVNAGVNDDIQQFNAWLEGLKKS